MLIFVLGANNYEHMQHYKNNNKKKHTHRKSTMMSETQQGVVCKP